MPLPPSEQVAEDDARKVLHALLIMGYCSDGYTPREANIQTSLDLASIRRSHNSFRRHLAAYKAMIANGTDSDARAMTIHLIYERKED